MDICMYSVFVLSFVDSDLATGCSHVQGVQLALYKITEMKQNFSQMPYAPKAATGNMNDDMN
jgi:hypothetical protein